MAQYKQLLLIRFPPQVDRDDMATVFEAYDELPTHILGIADVAFGPYTSPEGLNKGFTHAIALTFEEEEFRDACLAHPKHESARQKLAALLPGGLADLVVFDFKDCNRFLY